MNNTIENNTNTHQLARLPLANQERIDDKLIVFLLFVDSGSGYPNDTTTKKRGTLFAYSP